MKENFVMKKGKVTLTYDNIWSIWMKRDFCEFQSLEEFIWDLEKAGWKKKILQETKK